ncbi:hypothetical protein [Roseovarius sp. EL26]|uniref:hypothetical protein n=1 Tax=Roseovarius sp. EL26 TaxID=2126672 RepID=UPI0013C4933D|nr:hypothetical protein [Roseovarius sp. EL26]
MTRIITMETTAARELRPSDHNDVGLPFMAVRFSLEIAELMKPNLPKTLRVRHCTDEKLTMPFLRYSLTKPRADALKHCLTRLSEGFHRRAFG